MNNFFNSCIKNYYTYTMWSLHPDKETQEKNTEKCTCSVPLLIFQIFIELFRDFFSHFIFHFLFTYIILKIK